MDGASGAMVAPFIFPGMHIGLMLLSAISAAQSWTVGCPSEQRITAVDGCWRPFRDEAQGALLPYT